MRNEPACRETLDSVERQAEHRSPGCPHSTQAEGADPTGLLPEPSLFLFRAYLHIQRAVGNKMRVRILPLLAEYGVHNAEELAEALNIPLNTLHYHLDCRPSSARARWQSN